VEARRAVTSDTPRDDAETSRHRAIRSFVLRQGRFSSAQQRAYASLMPAFGIPFAPEILELDTTFGRSAPRVLEIGFGMGETTAEIARARPDFDFLAVEVHTPGVGSLLKLIDEQRLGNVRIIQHDAVEVVTSMIGAGTLQGVHVFFPDPWPKKRHHKRRLLQPSFVRQLAERVARGGYVHAATDWEEYALEILDTLSAEPLLRNSAANFASRPSYRPLTKFERRGLGLGHGVWDIIFTRW
jgi:tRNA (guanine-N7-)-methyltransferase